MLLTLLKELNDAFGPPFIRPIANTIESLIDMVQNVKQNKDQCAQLMAEHPSSPLNPLSPEMLDNIGKFMEDSAQDIYFLEGQQDRNRIKSLFRNNEDWTRLWKSLRLPPDLFQPHFSMLPSKPKIFYGRQLELETIMKMLNQESPRIAILGGGGMGKTSLAKAILQLSTDLGKIPNTGFCQCEAATTQH
ncbi:hypothetical protein B0H14DRAFT_3783345 [Mycena olivaceomarginata]|nr:hypothetical protein B0H14DRAFT_3783345 [Mycena olivaceomarginata]